MIIKEFLPNPIGNDKEGEYILLSNNGIAAVFLDGWKIKDASEREFFLKGKLSPGDELKLFFSETKIPLNNNGEQLQLFDEAGRIVDELSYSGAAEEGQIIRKLQMTNDNLRPNNTLIFNNSISNSQFSFSKNIIFIDFLIATILAGLMLYIILQLEKKLNQPLF